MKYVMLFMSLVLSQTAFAYGDSGRTTLEGKRFQVIGDSDPRVFIYDVTINNSGCSGITPVLVMSSTNILAKELYSALLTAKASGKEVQLMTRGCKDNNPIIFSVNLY
ncbi:hypothetical protein [Vibrio sp. TRT 17S01]|uniref:hypothetical protein n=1 Tax=Vibrio sp. TRT 17S01 TaxID=3418505 RepID=UPI003CF8A30C